MDSQTILVLTLAALVALALVVVAGATLTARSFTALTGLIAALGSLVGAHLQAVQQAQIGSSIGKANATKSSLTEDTPITRGNPDLPLTE